MIKRNFKFHYFILVFLLFLLLLIFFFSQKIFAEPTLTFDSFKSYKINSIIVSNLNYEKKAQIQIFAYTYDKKKILAFYSELKYFAKKVTCYFYAIPSFEKINLIIILDSKLKYSYEFKINTNKEAENDLLKFNFYQKNNYEILNIQTNKPVLKISQEYNPDFYSLLASTYLHYYDKKLPEKVSISLFFLASILYVIVLLVFINRKIRFLFLFLITCLFSIYILFLNDQNLLLKAYMTNPIEPLSFQINKENSELNNNVLDVILDLNIHEEKVKTDFLFFKFIKENSKSILIYQNNYKMIFSKMYFQNEKIPLNQILQELDYFKSIPEYFCIINDEGFYFIKQYKMLIFGKAVDEKN